MTLPTKEERKGSWGTLDEATARVPEFVVIVILIEHKKIAAIQASFHETCFHIEIIIKLLQGNYFKYSFIMSSKV